MSPQIARLLDEVRVERAAYGDSQEPPASEADLAVLVERSRQVLGITPPDAYLDFLRIEDGLNHNGLFLYGSADRALSGKPGLTLPGLVETNLLWRDGPDLRRYLVFGDGNLDLYCLHIETGTYRVLDRVPGDVIAQHESFDALIASALSAHL